MKLYDANFMFVDMNGGDKLDTWTSLIRVSIC